MSHWGNIWCNMDGSALDSEPYMWKFYRILLDGAALKGRKVLEIGCGTGINSILMAKAGARVTCVDMSRESLRLVREGMKKAGVSCRLMCEDAFDLDFENAFDIVTSEGVVEHFRQKPRQDILDVHARAAKRGGRVIIIVPNLHSPGYRLGKWLAGATGTWIYGNEYPYSVGELTKRMEQSGLEIERTSGGEFLFGFGWVFSPLWLRHMTLLGRALYSGASNKMVRLNYDNFLANRWGRVIAAVGRKK